MQYTHLPPFFSCLEFLLNVVQGDIPLWGWGKVVGYIWHWRLRLENHLKSLTWGPLVYRFHLHVCKWHNYNANGSKVKTYYCISPMIRIFCLKSERNHQHGVSLFNLKENPWFSWFCTFKVTHKLIAWLWVEAGADEGEDRQLLHLLFVCCKNIKP